MVAAITHVIGLLEQPRRSKMAWLKEWRALLELFGATETHLASCSFGSIHQKEFRILGVNIDVSPLHAPCTRDHTHVKVQGKFTKGTAVYTDLLAARFADVLDEAIRRKKSAEAILEPKVEGLESTLSNMCALSAPWKEETSWTWKRSPHINILEASAYSRLLYHLASKCPRSRFPVGLDSNVALSAIVKGRSPSFSLRPALRRIGATTIAGCLYPSCHFFPTRLNPSDHPTRDTEIPAPATSLVGFEEDPGLLTSMHSLSGLRRFASNWVRLTLLLIGPSRPWSSPKDCWTFATWTYRGYPFQWSSGSRKNRMDFDQTLGFPGEGPHALAQSFRIWLFMLSSWLLIAFIDHASPFGFSLQKLLYLDFVSPICSGWELFVLCLLPVWFVCWDLQTTKVTGSRSLGKFGRACLFLVLPWPSLAAPGVSGGLSKTTGDFKRAELRRGVVLEEGRPVLGKTKEARAKLITDFEAWLTGKGTSLSELLHPVALDIDSVNKALEMFGRDLHRSGRPYNHYAETINAVSALRPSLRRVLQGAWDLAFTWLREEPPTHHVAIPWQALLCLVSTAYVWNWPRVAGIIALSWGGITRIGEVLGAKRKHLVLPEDLGRTIQYCLLQIQEPKTRFKAARHQVAKLDQPQLLKVVEVAFEALSPEQALWPLSPQTLRLRFQKLVESVGLDRLPQDCKSGLILAVLELEAHHGCSWRQRIRRARPPPRAVDKQQNYGDLYPRSCIDSVSSSTTTRSPSHCAARCSFVPVSVAEGLLVVSMWLARVRLASFTDWRLHARFMMGGWSGNCMLA